jgi:hypothetical protein
MGFFTDRERNELNKLPENKLPEGSDRAREVVRPQGADRKAESGPIPDDPVALLQSVTRARVREIDMLITDLQTMRETLQSEASRVQREMTAYATFSETALQSSRVICESLRAGLRPFQHKRHKEKARSRARRKAARRLARISRTVARFESVDPEKAVGGSRG